MNLNVPLAVRLYNLDRGYDYQLTRWVEDFSFRHTAPGGCASCTIKLHIPREFAHDPQQWGRLFSRVQIIDGRDGEVLWEGRIEDPAQRTDEEVWELGVLGSAVCATDVTIPFIYVDNTLEHWESVEADAYSHSKEEMSKTLTTRLNSGYVFSAGVQYDVWTWVGGSKTATTIMRASCTYEASGPNATADDLFDQIMNASIYGNVDVTPFNTAGAVYKANIMADEPEFVDGLINQIYFSVRRNTSNYTIATSDQAVMRFRNPKVLGLRVNRFGNTLLTQANYSHGDFVYVRHVVEDVIGRWLIGNWLQGPFLSKANNSFTCKGSVKGEDAYVDVSDNTKITNLQFVDGATARDVLEALMGIQTNAYWAIWPSNYLSESHTSSYGNDPRFRFEWATWPESCNYIVSAEDGMDQQISAEDTYSHIFLRETNESNDQPVVIPSYYDGPYPAPGVTWDISETFQNQFDRVVFVDRTDNPRPIEEDSFHVAFTEGASRSIPRNAGTITIRRPIVAFDSGANSHHGQTGMIQPWEILPGKLIMIREIMPVAEANRLAMDTQQLPASHRNCVFRVAATTYNASDNSCVIELDQLPKWSVPTQIANPGPTGKISTW